MDVSPDWLTPADGWPAWVWTVRYHGAGYPGAASPSPAAGGANCQRYAYEVLGLFGHRVPQHRSSELWADQNDYDTIADGEFQPLDLLLFNPTIDPFGAHVGVYMGPDQILHLSREVGVPAVWTIAQFTDRDRYRVLLGAKRIRSTVLYRPGLAAPH